MNYYATLANVKSRMNISGTSNDSVLKECIEVASRMIDDHTNRHFFLKSDTKYYDGVSSDRKLINDVLSITTLTTDSESDGTYDGTTLTEGTDYTLTPYNDYPKDMIQINSWGYYGLAEQNNYIKAVSPNWGYGDGESATPWDNSGITITVGDASTTTCSISAEGTLQVGHTILVATEQMFVSAVTSDSSNEITVTRGVNGTARTAHSTTTANVYKYPRQITTAVYLIVERLFDAIDRSGLKSEKIGDYSYTLSEEKNGLTVTEFNILSPFRCWVV